MCLFLLTHPPPIRTKFFFNLTLLFCANAGSQSMISPPTVVMQRSSLLFEPFFQSSWICNAISIVILNTSITSTQEKPLIHNVQGKNKKTDWKIDVTKWRWINYGGSWEGRWDEVIFSESFQLLVLHFWKRKLYGNDQKLWAFSVFLLV